MITKQFIWTAFKALADSKEAHIQYYVTQGGEDEDWYHIWFDEVNMQYECRVKKEGTPGADQTDFETNYLPTSNQKQDLKTKIIEEEIGKETGGHFQAQSFEITTISTIDWYEKNFSFPMPISLLSATWINKASNDGDEVEFIVAPDTTTGSITAAVAVGATVIDVSQTVIDNAKLGYYLKLDDGTNVDDVGRITNIDTINSKITVETPTVNAFAVATPTYIKQSVKLVPKVMLVGTNAQIELGTSKIGGSSIPANTILRARYNNLSGSAETFSFILQYLY